MTVTESIQPVGARPIDTALLLQLHGISKSFGAVHALTDVDLDIPGG